MNHEKLEIDEMNFTKLIVLINKLDDVFKVIINPIIIKPLFSFFVHFREFRG